MTGTACCTTEIVFSVKRLTIYSPDISQCVVLRAGATGESGRDICRDVTSSTRSLIGLGNDAVPFMPIAYSDGVSKSGFTHCATKVEKFIRSVKKNIAWSESVIHAGTACRNARKPWRSLAAAAYQIDKIAAAKSMRRILLKNEMDRIFGGRSMLFAPGRAQWATIGPRK
jgi:hypothetical protein